MQTGVGTDLDLLTSGSMALMVCHGLHLYGVRCWQFKSFSF